MFVRPSVNSMDGTSQNTMEGRSIAASLSNASVKFG
ncbi:MAG: hypothetical protein ACI9AX_000536, partial [Polaromonas sp.]